MRHFTIEEIRELYARLSLLGIRDTDFSETDVMHDDDRVAIVQDGENRIIAVKLFNSAILSDAKKYAEEKDSETLDKAKEYIDKKTYSFADLSGKLDVLSQLDGIIPIEHLPQSALERLVKVEDDNARFALTGDDIQKGDTVKVISTGKMYFVTDDTKLDSEEGYEPYSANVVSRVSWSDVADRPTRLSEFENDGVFITKADVPAIDDTLDTESKNGIENGVVASALKKINERLFPLTLSVSGSASYEKGTSHTVVIRWTIRQGDDTIVPDSLTVNGKAVDVSSLSYTEELVASDKTYTVACAKDGVTKTASAYVRFYAPTYYGVVADTYTKDTVTSDMVTAMNKLIVSGKTSITVSDVVNSKIVYAYPKTFGLVSSVKDASGFENITAYEHGEIQIDSEVYYLYILKNSVTIASSTQKFS